MHLPDYKWAKNEEKILEKQKGLVHFSDFIIDFSIISVWVLNRLSTMSGTVLSSVSIVGYCLDWLQGFDEKHEFAFSRQNEFLSLMSSYIPVLF